ncbi:MAG: ATP-dependent helicase HrpB [Spirochaetes bacterium]|nr:ATP-dependent helicase HrpB [Spirochaetota bacterium]
MKNKEVTSLPIYEYLDRIADSLDHNGTLMLQAETGAGKTTLVPWRLLSEKSFSGGKILLLQPRRIAARAAAERVAHLLGEHVGETTGLRTRTETAIGPKTRLEVVTEGILTRIIQNDQSLEEYGTIIFDEFHERNLQTDMALAFTWDCRETIRPDLKILFMSATLSGANIRETFEDMELIQVPGRTHPVQVIYRLPLPGEKPWEGSARCAAETAGMMESSGGGDILVFLPGFREIRLARETIERSYPRIAAKAVVLHGRIPPADQRRILNPGSGERNRIILSTNVAETSLTIPGVRAVVDSGLERRVRYRPRTGMDHWDTVEISAASAEQRKGRAGRLGPGICIRWWDEHIRREEYSPPEIIETDLTPLVLETSLWGAASPFALKWLTDPPPGAMRRASALLAQLSLIDGDGRITESGRRVAGMGLHPRLGRMVLSAAKQGWLATAAVTAAILEEGGPLGDGDPDFRNRLEAWAAWTEGRRGSFSADVARRIADEVRRIMHAAGIERRIPSKTDINPDLAGKLILMAYPDRAARRVTSPGHRAPRWVLATGRSARATGSLAKEEFLATAELDGGETEARIFSGAPITIGDLEGGPTGSPAIEKTIEWNGWETRVNTRKVFGRIILEEKKGESPPPGELRRLTAERIRTGDLAALPWNDTSIRFRKRCLFVYNYGQRKDWPDFSVKTLTKEAESWLIPHLNLKGGAVITEKILLSALELRLGNRLRHLLNILAPEYLILPSGSRKSIDYEKSDIPIIAAKIQEFFGYRDTPRLCGEPLILHLLSPASRPVQVTRDLDGFWDRSYPEIKKELQGRYPRHYWPDNPREAAPTSRAKPRKTI